MVPEMPYPASAVNTSLIVISALVVIVPTSTPSTPFTDIVDKPKPNSSSVVELLAVIEWVTEIIAVEVLVVPAVVV